ncbi:MAG: hypothetical protein V3V01_07945 [Acidimicrobiales bacterium]
MAKKSKQFHLDERVEQCAERNAGVSWPIPLDARLDAILEIARDDGTRTTRKELIAAMLFDFEPDPDYIADVLRRYRRARVAEVMIHEIPDGENVIELHQHGPGPRTRDAGTV